MSYLNVTEEFPCGYKTAVIIRSWFLTADTDERNSNGCPLHGKNCNKEIKVKKGK